MRPWVLRGWPGCPHGAYDIVVGDGRCCTSDLNKENLMTLVISAMGKSIGCSEFGAARVAFLRKWWLS